MKFKHLFILFFTALFLGCDGPGDFTKHYIYGNATDKTVSVQAFVHYNSGRSETKAKFSLQPGEKFTLSYFPVGPFGGRNGYPFDWANEVIISNGDTTIVHTRENVLYVYRSLQREEAYDKYTSKNGRNAYFEFVFTDKDFEDMGYFIPEDVI